MYADLTKADTLRKCLHGLTQNPNESFNSTIWERAPKTVYWGLDTLELAVYDAVANYNYGRKATIVILKHLNIIPGVYTTRRKYNAGNHSTPATKPRRKILRGLKKKKVDKYVTKERGNLMNQVSLGRITCIYVFVFFVFR